MSRLIAALVLLTPAGASAQSVTFDEALALGEGSPVVEGRRRELAARADGDEGIGGTAGVSTITVMPGAALSPDQDRGLDLQITATQGWNLADLGAVRRRAASDERAALSARVRAQALGARLEAARRWIDVATLQSVSARIERLIELASRRRELAERALAVGVGSALDVSRAAATSAELERRRLDVEGDRRVAAHQLAVAMGRAPGPSLTARGPLPAPRLPSEAEVRARLADVDVLPQLAVRRLAASAARAREAEASAEYAPVLSVGAQLERSSTDAWVIYGIASLSFQAFGEERRAVSVAQAAVERADADLEVARVRARAEVEDVVHEVEHTREQLAVIEQRLIPALGDLVARQERAVEAGEATRFALTDARQQLALAEELRARALGARSWAEVRLWLLLSEVELGGRS